MNKYEILHNQLLELKQSLEERLVRIQATIDRNGKIKNKYNKEIEELESKKTEQNHIYDILVNYKKYMKEEIKKHVKLGSNIAGVIGVFAMICVFFVTSQAPSALLPGLLYSITGSLLVGAYGGIATFIDDTKYIRNTNKNNKNKLYVYPVSIANLDKTIHHNYEFRSVYEEEILNLKDKEDKIKICINQIEYCIEALTLKMPNILYAARHQDDIVDEFFENDEDLVPVLKLIRENKEDAS